MPNTHLMARTGQNINKRYWASAGSQGHPTSNSAQQTCRAAEPTHSPSGSPRCASPRPPTTPSVSRTHCRRPAIHPCRLGSLTRRRALYPGQPPCHASDNQLTTQRPAGSARAGTVSAPETAVRPAPGGELVSPEPASLVCPPTHASPETAVRPAPGGELVGPEPASPVHPPSQTPNG
jgi:hypothetical protein